MPDSHFEAGLSAMGPILAATDGKRTLLLAYEHGSQAPDAFVRFDLAPGRRVTLRAVKGSYWPGPDRGRRSPLRHGLAPGGPRGGRPRLDGRGLPLLRRAPSSRRTRRPGPPASTTTPGTSRSGTSSGTAEPYLESMNAARMLAEIDVAARMGIETFVLDTGWYEKTGDWAVSRARFPEGLAPLKARLDAHGMKLGLWFNPNAAAVSSRVGAENQAYRMSWKGESKASARLGDRGELPDVPRLALGRGLPEGARAPPPRDGRHVLQVGRGGAVRLRRAGPRPRHRRPTRAEERADAYAFRIGLRLAEIAEKLGEQVPGAVVDFDVTEGGRAVGLAFLTAGRYFLVNNGPYYQNYDVPIDPQKDNWNLFFHKGAARTWITRSTYGYDKWIPAELFLTHYFPDDPEDAQLVGIGSLILGHNGIWGDLLSVSPEGVARFGTLLGLWRQVRESMAVASPVRQGAVGGSGEVHEKIEHETGRGAIVIFSTARGRQRYVSEHPGRSRALGDRGHDRHLRRAGPGGRGRGLRASRGRDRLLRGAGGGEMKSTSVRSSRSCWPRHPRGPQAPEANYDEAKVPAYTLPDPLRIADGTAVTDAAAWRERRRPELLRLFEEHVYGRSPGAAAGMRFVVVESDPTARSAASPRAGRCGCSSTARESGPAFEILLYVPNAARAAGPGLPRA